MGFGGQSAYGFGSSDSGAGDITGGGTVNFISKFTPTGTSIGNSQIYDDGTFIGFATTTAIDTEKYRFTGGSIATQTIFPEDDDTYDLGTDDFRWANLFLASTIDYASDLDFVSTTTQATLTTAGIFTAKSFVANGTGGAGFVTLIGQTSAPSAPASGVSIYGDDVADRFAWIPASGFGITLDQFGLTANRAYTFPDANVQLAGQSATLTTGSVIFAGATGLLAQDNAKFFWDDTVDMLGIGTSTPSFDIHIAKTGNTDIMLDSAGTDISTYRGRTYGGTLALPTATLANSVLVALSGSGYDGTSFTTFRGAYVVQASETFTGSAQGTFLSFYTTTEGTTAITEKARMLHNGNWGFGLTAPTEKLQIAGNIAPDGNGTRDLGTSLLGWANLYLSSTIHYATTLGFTNAGTPRASLDTTGKFQMLQPVGTLTAWGNIFSNTADSNSVSNTATETNFNTAVTIPANSLTVGSRFRIFAWGIYSVANTGDTLTFRVKYGTTTLVLIATFTFTATQTNEAWNGVASIRVTAIGASGSMRADGNFFVQGARGGSTGTSNGDVTVDTTLARDLQISAKWNQATSGTTIKVQNMSIEFLKG